ncbi:aminotransferase class IV [Gemmata sp.]|uniref:aminotransferase class IV n=1 Tax=Gemmata sp. TaxID=1914242 RepID=UPI003F72D5F1
MSLLWINGTLTDKDAARVSPFDHGFLYGDGVWEHLRVFGGRAFKALDHINQLVAAAEVLGIDVPLSPGELAAAIDATARANNRTDGYVRVIVSRGPGTIGPDPRKVVPQVMIVAEEYRPFPDELYGHGLHAVVFPVPLDTAHPANRVRTLGLPHAVLAKRHALANGCLEAISTNHAGHLVGATEGFLFLVKDGAVVVAGDQPRDVTGYAVAALAGERGLVVAEYTVTAADLDASEEAFIAGTACGVIGLVRVDGRDIGTGTEGPVTRAIRARYAAATRVPG